MNRCPGWTWLGLFPPLTPKPPVVPGRLTDGPLALGRLADGPPSTCRLADGPFTVGRLAEGPLWIGRLADGPALGLCTAPPPEFPAGRADGAAGLAAGADFAGAGAEAFLSLAKLPILNRPATIRTAEVSRMALRRFDLLIGSFLHPWGITTPRLRELVIRHC